MLLEGGASEHEVSLGWAECLRGRILDCEPEQVSYSRCPLRLSSRIQGSVAQQCHPFPRSQWPVPGEARELLLDHGPGGVEVQGVR